MLRISCLIYYRWGIFWYLDLRFPFLGSSLIKKSIPYSGHRVANLRIIENNNFEYHVNRVYWFYWRILYWTVLFQWQRHRSNPQSPRRAPTWPSVVPRWSPSSLWAPPSSARARGPPPCTRRPPPGRSRPQPRPRLRPQPRPRLRPHPRPPWPHPRLRQRGPNSKLWLPTKRPLPSARSRM